MFFSGINVCYDMSNKWVLKWTAIDFLCVNPIEQIQMSSRKTGTQKPFARGNKHIALYL